MSLLSYIVDSGDRIASVAGEWDRFAVENGAPELLREGVLGRPLLDFVTGDATRELVGLLMAAARRGVAVSVPFRCDSPPRRRYLRLDIVRWPEGNLRFDTSILREEERPARRILDSEAPRSSKIAVLCSWCRRARVEDGSWVEVDIAVESLGLFAEPEPPRVSHGICPTCAGTIRRDFPPPS